MPNLNWQKCPGNQWCVLQGLDTSAISYLLSGVYIIWLSGDPGQVVRVGQGIIQDRLESHQNDSEILACADHGVLYVTWAYVQAHQQDGVERFLADHYQPLIGDRFPDANPIAVNLPE